MNLIIKPLTPSLTADYFDFFDNRAFSDNSPFYPCYCNAFQMTEEQIKTEFFERAEAKGGGTEEFRKAIRESAVPMVERGIIQGYLAYDNDLAIGWCNANDRKNYIRVGEFNLDTLSAEYVHHISSSEEASRRIKSIVCFEIAPEYRGKGIASALLDRVCEDAAIDGYDMAEVYPVIRDTYTALDFTGPVHLYEKAGFVLVSRQGNACVMQKNLKIEK